MESRLNRGLINIGRFACVKFSRFDFSPYRCIHPSLFTHYVPERGNGYDVGVWNRFATLSSYIHSPPSPLTPPLRFPFVNSFSKKESAVNLAADHLRVRAHGFPTRARRHDSIAIKAETPCARDPTVIYGRNKRELVTPFNVEPRPIPRERRE